MADVVDIKAARKRTKAKKADGAPPAAADEGPGECPVRGLGTAGGWYFFLTPSGQFRALKAAGLNKLGIADLFETEIGWLWQRWPRLDRDGEKVVGWNFGAAGEWLIGQCAEESKRHGLFDPETQVRGPGVWRLAAGGLAVHAGNAVWVGGEWRPAGARIDGVVYPAWPPDPRPDFARPADAKAARRMLAVAKRWAWRSPTAPRLLVGWMGAAMVCGGLTWRPHLYVPGDSGTGKSELERLIRGVLGAVERASDPTAASIRQLLGSAYRPVMLDEVEPTPDGRAERVLEVARIASSDDQAPVTRGGVDGRPSRQYVRAIFYFTSILHPRPKPQDRSRITFLDLDDLPKEVDAESLRRDVEALVAMGPALRARMILGWERFRANLQAYHSVLTAFAYGRRQADQLAALLACGETLLFDEPAEPAAASDLVAAMGLDRPEEVERDHDECLTHLLSQTPDLWRSGERRTIGELVAEAGDDAGHEARHVLPRYGLAPYPATAGGRWTELRVANRHAALDGFFAGTRWGGGVWPQALRRAGGGEVPTTSFAGVKQRAVALPRALFEDKGRQDESGNAVTDGNG